jgi:pyrroloquinoline quinone biosynthesis protein B
MRFLVLGSGAGGGLPQWNAFNASGRAAFSGDPLVPFRGQCGAAVSLDGVSWVLLNASPDLRAQIIANPQLHPRTGPRSSPIKAVLLTGAEIDQIAGLLTLRERHEFSVFCSNSALNALLLNPIFEALAAERVTRLAVAPGTQITPLPGLKATPIDVPGKVPLYLECTRADPTARESGDCLAWELEANGKRAIFMPGCAEMTADLAARIEGTDLLLIDGTLHTDGEMIARGEGAKTGRRMGHIPMTGPGGAVEALASLKIGRRMFIHINNTNPVIRLDSPERANLRAAGWEIAEDGMEIWL